MDERRFFARALATLTLGTTLALVPLLLAPSAGAQEADFLFGRPGATLGVFGGFAAPRAESDVFDFTTDEFTVDEDDFHSFTLGGSLGYRWTERIDLAAEVGFARANARSEYRDWVDMDDRPIEQTTRFTRVPVTLSLRAYLRERGRSVGRFAWVPTSWSPYVGAGGGWMWYSYTQEGDFVDVETLDIVSDRIRSDGFGPTGHVLAGTDVSLGPRFALNAEGRYSWARAAMDPVTYEGFDRIDLSGFQLTLGLLIRL